jgi:flagellin
MSHFGAMAETATVRGLKTPNDLNYWGYNFSTAVANGGFTAAHLKNFLTVDVDNSGNPVTVDLSALAANDRMYFGAEIAQAIEDDANAKFANQGELGIDVTYDSLNQKFAISSLTIDNSSAIEVNFSVPVFDANGVPTGVVDAQGNKLLFHNLRSAPFMGFEVTGSYNSKYSGSIDAAINIIDTALEELTAQRAEYGAMQNRLQYTISNLMNVSEQTTAARSRIEDADFATESAVLAKSQVLQQSGAAMLAQANARPQLVLQLIK